MLRCLVLYLGVLTGYGTIPLTISENSSENFAHGMCSLQSHCGHMASKGAGTPQIRPGEVWVVNIPHLGTHEQSGIRPAVIVARVTKTIVTVIPCTGSLAALRFPFTLALAPGKRNGLTTPSVALIFHLRAIDTTYLVRKIGSLDVKTLAALRAEARKLIG